MTTNNSHCFPVVYELAVAKSIKSNLCREKTKWWSLHNPEGKWLSPVSPVME